MSPPTVVDNYVNGSFLPPSTGDYLDVTNPANGSVTINNSTGLVTYTPDENFNGNVRVDLNGSGNGIGKALQNVIIGFVLGVNNEYQ